MVRRLLMRGMLVGILAGVLALAFAEIFGEPQIDRAIHFETQMHVAAGDAPEPVLVSRKVQRSLGLATAVIVYGAAFGGIFALVFAFALGRLGRLRPRVLSLLLAGAGFFSIVLIPTLKYPANPPSVGRPETIAFRTALYFLMLLVSVAALILVVMIGRRLASRHGGWNAALMTGAVFIVIIAGVQWLLPTANEVPPQFPAVVLWKFRIASLGTQLVLWATIGLLFGALTERDLASRYNAGYSPMR
jgi:predicted cobalt transporter CbtA